MYIIGIVISWFEERTNSFSKQDPMTFNYNKEVVKQMTVCLILSIKSSNKIERSCIYEERIS